MKKRSMSRSTALLLIILTALVLSLGGCKSGDADGSPDPDTSVTGAEESVLVDETMVIEEEFTIELDKNQSTGSL